MRAATHRFAVAVEDRGHFAAATRLADRVLVDALPWCDGILDTMRRWGTGPDERPWHSLTKSYRAARERGLKIWGHFDGEPGLSDASMVRAQLLIFQADQVEGEQIDAVVLARDLDDDPERALGFQQVLTQRWPFPVLVESLFWPLPSGSRTICAANFADQPKFVRNFGRGWLAA